MKRLVLLAALAINVPCSDRARAVRLRDRLRPDSIGPCRSADRAGNRYQCEYLAGDADRH